MLWVHLGKGRHPVSLFRLIYSLVNLLENLTKPQTNSFRKGFLIFMIYKAHRLTEKSPQKIRWQNAFFQGPKKGPFKQICEK